MPLTIHHETTREGVRIRLVERDIASFAIVYSEGDLFAIAHRTTDFACARVMFDRSVSIAALGFTHPGWKKPAARTINITKNGERP